MSMPIREPPLGLILAVHPVRVRKYSFYTIEQHFRRFSSRERDRLKDALAVVKRFKAMIRNQFHLEAA